MADVKISDLTDGGEIQPGDLIEIERPGSPGVSRKAALGVAAGRAVGTTAGTVAAGDDSRITGALQAANIATDAQYRSAASGRVLTADLLESAMASVSVAETGSSPTLSLANFDWDLFINGAVTLSASRTLSNPATSQVGTWRRLIVTQNGTGGYTLSFGNQYRFPGGIVPVVASAANAVTTLDIYCRSASLFDVYAAIGMAS